MLKSTKWTAATVAGILLVTGIGLTEAWEYLQVAHAEVSEAVQNRIPVPVEIDRLKLLVSQLDEQILQHHRQVAEAAVALENAEQEVAGSNAELQDWMTKMAGLRNLLRGDVKEVRVGCSRYAKCDIEAALQANLVRYKAANQAVTQREAALERQRESYRTLAGRMAEWKHQRDLLNQKVETLKSDYNAQLLAAPTATPGFDPSKLERAKELARRIEERLKVEQKLQDLSIDPLVELSPSDVAGDVVGEFDELLASEQ